MLVTVDLNDQQQHTICPIYRKFIFSDKIKSLSQPLQEEIKEDIEKVFLQNADLSMVDSDRGITNLHVPSDVIIDASMPAMIRNSGKMWDKNGKTRDTKAIIPDSSYAAVYSATIDFCKENGAFDPTTMGTCLLYTSPSPRDRG